MSKRYIGNRELINDIASSSVLSEVFIIQAIGNYALNVLDMSDADFGKSPIINPDLWREIATDALGRIENRANG